MKINYIHHSGFLIETRFSIYIFDYYKGKLPAFDTSKPVTVFSSHGHSDHYNPKIFDMLREAGCDKIQAVLSDDISPKLYPSSVSVTKVCGDGKYDLGRGDVLKTLFSTDFGVAFLLETNDGTFFHAGDLNDWRWEEEEESVNHKMLSSYCREIQKLKNVFIDHAFVPLDPRQDSYCGEGLKYFLENCIVKYVYPMHWWGRGRVIDEFLEKNPIYSDVIQHTDKL